MTQQPAAQTVTSLLSSRITWQIVGASLALSALCILLAVSLFEEQVEIQKLQHDSLTNRREADRLEESLIDLAALLEQRVEDVATLNERVELHLRLLEDDELSTGEDPRSTDIRDSFHRYRALFDQIPSPNLPRHGEDRRAALRILIDETIPKCRTYRGASDERLDQASQAHAQVLRKLAWGFAAVGVIGSLAGVGLGFAAALGWRSTMRRLQVHIRDAAGKIRAGEPEIVLTGEGDLLNIDSQLAQLTRNVEAVVERLRQREVEVLRAEQMAAVGQLAAGVAHEIRNPLTSIKLLVQAGREPGTDSPLTSEDLAIVEREVLRMEKSLQIFIDFARPPRVERREVDLSLIVEQTLELLRGRAEKQVVLLQYDPPASPIRRRVDPEQLRQVLLNLTLNALDAMPEGGVLSLDLVEVSGGTVELMVRDTGPGIPVDAQERFFQPFQSGKETGLGLGLVISRRIVEEHGGQLTAQNLERGGACFTVRLPGETEVAKHDVGTAGG